MQNKFLLLIAFGLVLFYSCSEVEEVKPINVLILSGAGNHEWKKTTPLIEKMYADKDMFTTSVTERPDTIKYKDYKKYDVVVSNWNTWPDNDMRWPSEKEEALLRYVNEGGGFVSIHAGASSFYEWEDYHEIGIGRWGKETAHGRQTKGKIFGFDQSHPVTKGLSHFYIIDEIWEKTDIHPSAKPLGKLASRNVKDGHPINENAVFVNRIGNGRSFYTILGHNQRALFNTGLKTLIVRGTEWAAKGIVTTDIPIDLRIPERGKLQNYLWSESDTTFSLSNNEGIVWQYNFNNRYNKPYFHPVVVNNSTLTCVAPLDHTWHLGLWFSWKFINKVNYWEYVNEYKTDETGFKSEGITEIKNIATNKNEDFSANITLDIDYHPDNGETVLTEKRDIYISTPERDGSYFIDYKQVFTAIGDEVEIDRTPLPGERGGKNHGGYAGLSIRYNQDFTTNKFIASEEQESFHGKKGDWLYMGMKSLTGEKTGICFLQDSTTITEPSGWFIVDNQETPFHYFSPSPIFHKKIVLKKAETLVLKYRAYIVQGELDRENLEKRMGLFVEPTVEPKEEIKAKKDSVKKKSPLKPVKDKNKDPRNEKLPKEKDL
jgi:type 1 glutamine amidotransferase